MPMPDRRRRQRLVVEGQSQQFIKLRGRDYTKFIIPAQTFGVEKGGSEKKGDT